MTTLQLAKLLLLATGGFLFLPLVFALIRRFAVEVQPEQALLVQRFGQLQLVLREPGWHWLPSAILPWVQVQRVSLQRDFHHFHDIHINNARGTTMRVDLWLELRITDAQKAMYEVVDWNRSLQNLVQHAAISILGSREFEQILTDRSELSELLKRDLGAETARWGVSIEQVFVRNVSLLPEVARQVLETIAARLERAKAEVEEEGRLQVAKLDAETSVQVATLLADAKGQYPAALGRLFAQYRSQPAVLAAYHTLYELSLVRPQRTVSFSGFASDELRTADAMLLTPPSSDAPRPPEQLSRY